MSFLNNTGLAYFYSKLKEKFIQTINGKAPDRQGNVQINQVSLANNLTSPDAQASIDTFTYRTSGGNASLDSGEANLIFINGNTEASGRITELWSATTTNNINCTVDNINKTVWRNQVTETGNTVFTYSTTIDNTNVSSWTSNSTWTPALDLYGMDNNVISNVINYSISCIANGENITSATINPSIFNNLSIASESNTYTFTYQKFDEEEAGNWYFQNEIIALNTYGITIVGTPIHNDTIIVNWIKGTPINSTVTIYYRKPSQGSLINAKPIAFQSTGFNQFDKNSMVINNATISGSSIVEDPDQQYSICYCPAKGGDQGYAAVSPGSHIIDSVGMAYSQNIPAIGETVITVSININDTTTPFAGRFTAENDGYILVVVNNADDLMMGCAWSDYISDIQEELSNNPNFYIGYTSPSQIPVPMYGYDEDIRIELPTASYGLPRVGNYYDTINFDAHIYIQRVAQKDYSLENLAIVQDYYDTYGTPYDYDDQNIFYALDGNSGVGSPITYTLEKDGSYTTSANGIVTSIDFDNFIKNALPAILEYDNIIHDKYVFENTGADNTHWYYGNQGQIFNFIPDWGVTFGSPLAGDTLTIYIPISSIYQIDDHGTEKVVGNNIPVEVELLYGQNLRDKLRTDVLTISEQDLYPTQISQVYSNLKLFDSIYPVGSIYMSVNSTDPSTLFGGSWQRIQDRFLLAAGSSYGAGSTGGVASVTLTANQSGLRSHNHAASAGYTIFGCKPNSNITRSKVNVSGGTRYAFLGTSGATTSDASNLVYMGDVAYAGGWNAAEAHTNMPPYLAVYIWQRIA